MNPLMGKAGSAGGGGGFTKSDAPPAGNRLAVCAAVIDLGTHEQGAFQGAPRPPVRQLFIVWELPKCLKAGTNRNHLIAERYNLSFHEKASLRKMLESWRGQPYRDGSDIDVSKVAGRPCFLNIAHDEKGDRVYPKIKAVAPLPDEVQAPALTVNGGAPLVWFIGCDAPVPTDDWLPWCYGQKVADMIQDSPEWQALQGGARPARPAATAPARTPPQAAALAAYDAASPAAWDDDTPF